MAQKRVFIGGRPKTAKEQSTEVSAPQAKDSDDDAEDGTEDKRSSSDEVQAYEKKKDALHAFRVNGFKYRYTQSNDCDVMCCLSRPTGKGSNFHKTDCGCCVRLHRQLCTIAVLRMPPLLRPHPAVPWHGCMLRPIVHPAVRRAFFAMTQPTSHALNVEFISVPCMLPVSVPRRYVWHCANGECNLLPH